MRPALTMSLLWCASIVLATGARAGSERGDALNHVPSLAHGQALFEICATCHHADGSGAGKKGIPAIAGQHYEIILNELMDFRASRRLDARMEVYASRHELPKGQDLSDVAAFIAAMPAVKTTDFGSGQHTNEGRLAYERSCIRCHGGVAEGDSWLGYPRLAGQHYTYLLNQLDAMIGGYRSNAGWEHEKWIVALSDNEITGMADYLARLGNDTRR